MKHVQSRSVSDVTQEPPSQAPENGGSTGEAELTIDELAQRTGMTVRNIRAHQSRGLLQPPIVRARTGYYGTDHVARIELIREMQAEGFNLEAIRRLLAGSGEASGDVLRFTRALREPFEDEQPEIVTIEELAGRFGSAPDLLRKAQRLGLLRPLGDGRYEQLSPRLARAGDELSALGVSPEVTLEVAAKLRHHAKGVSRAFVELFLDEVWKPFLESENPDQNWPRVLEALERLRPLAAEATLAVFQLTMTEAVEKALGNEVEKMRRNSRSRQLPSLPGLPRR